MERKKRKRFAFGELIQEGRLRSHDSGPNSGIYLDLVTYSSIPKRIGGRRDLPDGTSEFDSSTSRIAKVFGLSLAFSGGTRGPLSSGILSSISFSSICSYVAMGGEGNLGGIFFVRVTNFSVVILSLTFFYYDWQLFEGNARSITICSCFGQSTTRNMEGAVLIFFI